MMISFKGRNSDHVDCTLNSDSPVCCSKKNKKRKGECWITSKVNYIADQADHISVVS